MNLETRLRSSAIRYFSSPKYREKNIARARKFRHKSRQDPIVHYFHQVDDPYSHLAVQKLNELKKTYDIKFLPHLVSIPDAIYQGNPLHFAKWSWRDAQLIAQNYNTTFSPSLYTIDLDQVNAANATIFPRLNDHDFAEVAIEVGTAIWSGNDLGTENNLASSLEAVRKGNELRKKLGHYQGAMFFFEGEWFWGVDRIRLLEHRLREEGFSRYQSALCVPEPRPPDIRNSRAIDITLEYFPSLRSPYTAAGHKRVLDLVNRSNVKLEVRPVMPMLMRGIPAPRSKQRYIITDASREARAHGVPFGRIIDPFGEPVKRAFSLFPSALDHNRAMEFITAYIDAAWYDGIDITKHRGLNKILSNAGLQQNIGKKSGEDIRWKDILENNLEAMLSENLWGVPSFRISGGELKKPVAFWGQDRIWRVETEIAQRQLQH